MPEDKIDPNALDFLNQSQSSMNDDKPKSADNVSECFEPENTRKNRKKVETEQKRVTFTLTKESDIKLKLINTNLSKLVPQLLNEYLAKEDVQKLIKENIKAIKN